VNGFFLALVPPFLWAVANHLEKYTISNYFKKAGVGTMMIFSSFIAVFVLPFSFLLQTQAFSIAPLTALLIALNGCLYLSATFPYLKALKLNDASAVVPIFQLIPVISFVLGYIFLGETLTKNQLIGGALVVLGAIVISLEISEEKKYRLKKDVLLLMALSSLIYSFHFLFFKMFAVDTQFWTTEFWENIGFIGFGLVLVLFIKSYRREFKEVMKENGKAVIAINSVNEVVNITAKMIFNYASLLVPIALSWVAVGFQPVFVLAISIFLAIFFPHISKEKVLGKHLVQKIACIVIMTIGVYILHVGG
jgi:uncharacterized membrane protein